jgi:hypothetical protein
MTNQFAGLSQMALGLPGRDFAGIIVHDLENANWCLQKNQTEITTSPICNLLGFYNFHGKNHSKFPNGTIVEPPGKFLVRTWVSRSRVLTIPPNGWSAGVAPHQFV